MIKKYFLLLISALVLNAHAAPRNFPVQAQVASVQFDVFPNIVLNGQVNRLAPGARIWNQQNLITMPASLYAQQFVVRYTLNNEKQIDRIWILRDEEQ